ncbi:MAG: hypothetical protein JSV99_08165 [Planctomycetota bacterium]|nr:MAG: hypothetical protein JSV99_08165 [Planctomycetota bacterium]
MVAVYKHGFSRQSLLASARPALFFVLFFFLVCLWIDPKLIYHGHGQYLSYQIHVPGMRTFVDSPPFPGKAVEYLSAILAHYYFYSWAGALIITLTAGLLSVGTDKFITPMDGGRYWPLRFVPAVILLMQYGRYYHYLADSLSLSLGLLFLYLSIRIPLRSAVPRFAVFLVFSGVMYTMAVQAYLVFVILWAIFEFFNRRNWRIGLLYLLSAVLIPLFANMLFFNMDLFDAYRRMLSLEPIADRGGLILKFSLLFFLPIAGLSCALRPFLAPKRESERAKPGRTWMFLQYYRQSRLRWPLETLALLIVTAGALLLTCDRFAKIHLRINYLARNKMWNELLREARRLPAKDYSVFVCNDVNRALYHTAQLAYDMFSYPQHPSGLLSATERYSELDTLYELGHINRAEDTAYGALALADYYPTGLQKLALINILKGQTDAARTFLHALSKDSLYKDWAERYLDRLETDPVLSADEHIQHMRSVMLVEDNLRRAVTATDDLYLILLEKNRLNRMAFEYLMAWFLLNGHLEDFIRNLNRLDDFDYTDIPRHYAEAILLYTGITGRIVDLHGRKINVQTVSRFADFMQQSQSYKYHLQNAFKSAPNDSGDFDNLSNSYNLEDFKDTYYYYYFLVGLQQQK